MDERRQHLRYEVKEPIRGTIKPRMEIRVINISEGGLLVEAPYGLPPAGVCEVTLDLPDGAMVVRARVARCRASMVKTAKGGASVVFHAGLSFDKELTGSPRIKKLIDDLNFSESDIDVTGQVAIYQDSKQMM